MKILYVTTCLDNGSVSRIIATLAIRMKSHGYEVVVVSYEMSSDSKVQYQLEYNRIKVKYLNCKKNEILKAKRRLQDYIRGFSPDIVHSHLARGHITALLAKSDKQRFKLVGTFHSTMDYLHPISKFFIGTYAKRFDAITAVSASTLSTFPFAQSMGQDAHVIYNPLFSEFTGSEGISNNRERLITILGVGRLLPDKGFMELIRAFRIVQKTFKSELWIVGTGPQEEKLKILAGKLLLGNVKFMGFRSDVSSLMRRAHLVVAPSTSEGFGYAPIEALVSGTPVLAHAMPVTKEILGFDSPRWLTNCKVTKTLAIAMMTILKNYGTYLTAVEKIKADLLTWYHPTQIVKEYLALYGRLTDLEPDSVETVFEE